jgi:hypothetical protein
MAFGPRVFREEEVVTPQQRDVLESRRVALLAEMNKKLDSMPDDMLDKQELIAKRDHCMSKFPKFPTDLSIWIIAYHEDWLRAYDSVMNK